MISVALSTGAPSLYQTTNGSGNPSIKQCNETTEPSMVVEFTGLAEITAATEGRGERIS